MKYLLQIYPPYAREEFDRMPEDERQAIVEEYLAIGRSPEVIGGEQLQPIETATTVRVENGETLLTDGPFVDAKEVVAGFYILEAPDLDAALAIARTNPVLRAGGGVEVRPVHSGGVMAPSSS